MSPRYLALTIESMVLSFTEMGKTMGGRVCRSSGVGRDGSSF